MLENTFVHIPGIGYVIEKRLWDAGITCWEEALVAGGPPGSFSAQRWALVRDVAQSSALSLHAEDHRYFSQTLASRDHWRAYPNFRHRIAYVDIETTGMNYADAITVIGLYDGVRVKSYIAGENLADFAEEVARYSLLVTFNGATFDLPFLRRAFPKVAWDHLHIDLRYALGALGLKGGLKNIERLCGLARDDDIEGLCGDDAVRLWYEHCRGSRQALETLVKYNAADVQNLERLIGLAYEGLRQRLVGPPCPV